MHKSRIAVLILVVLIGGCSQSTPDGKGQVPQAKKEIGSLDIAGDTNGNATVAKGKALLVAGWAIDTAAGAPVQSVTVLVDGDSVGTATLGIARRDVSNYYGRDDYANCGWTFQMPTGTLSAGQHTVTARAAGPSGTAQLGSKTVSIQ